MERLFENPWQILCFADKVAVLYKRLARAGDVSLLKNVSAQQIGAHLSGDRDHWDRIGVGSGYTCYQVCRSGTRGCDAYAGLAAATRIAACRVLLLADENMLDIRIIDFVVERANRRSGIAKDDLDALCLQTFYHYLSTADHVSYPPCPIDYDDLQSNIHNL